jgi:ribA/ribD-fused uncharacterized protein
MGQELTAEIWNEKHPIGTKVRYFPIKGIKEYENEYVDSETRSEAWTLGHGAPIVKIVGIAGGVSLEHLQILTEGMMQEPVFIITQSKWNGLSNFADSEFSLDGKTWKTVEHYFQAQKTTDEKEKERVRKSFTPKIAKQAGRQVQLRSDWEDIKIDVMRKALAKKFEIQKYRELLLLTKERPIYEDANWDAFWGTGQARGTGGKNTLGNLLMELRKTIQSGENNEHSNRENAEQRQAVH